MEHKMSWFYWTQIRSHFSPRGSKRDKKTMGEKKWGKRTNVEAGNRREGRAREAGGTRIEMLVCGHGHHVRTTRFISLKWAVGNQGMESGRGRMQVRAEVLFCRREAKQGHCLWLVRRMVDILFGVCATRLGCIQKGGTILKKFKWHHFWRLCCQLVEREGSEERLMRTK